MTTMTLSICGERKPGGYIIRRFAYSAEGVGDERPRDVNYVLSLVNRLTDGRMETSWVEGKPTKGLMRLFDIYVDVENHGKPNARYAIDYRKYNGCPLPAVNDGMESFAAIKKYGIRPAMKNIIAKKEERKAKRRAI